MSKYLKLLAIVEEDYESISGNLKVEGDIWSCENVLSIKLNDDFSVIEPAPFDKFVDVVLKEAKGRVDG
jgi:hypothetical protein